MDVDLLTKEERRAVELLAQVFNLFDGIMRSGPTREHDMAEVTMLVHGLQNMILAQAAARAYPAEFRLLGGVHS